MMDRTLDFIAAVEAQARRLDLPQESLTQLKSAAILRPVKKRSAFTTAAAETVRSIEDLRQFIRSHKKDYVSLGSRYSSTDKDRIESEVGLFVRACTQQIERLKASVQAADSAGQLPPQAAAHCYGLVLILSDHLHLATAAFDRCRAIRYRQALQAGPLEQFKKQRKLKVDLHEEQLHDQQPGVAAAAAAADGEQQQQQALQQESRALIEQLTKTAGQVQQVERGMREISTLNQMLSTAVMQQVESIETLYSNALEATASIKQGNVHIHKTIEVNRSSRKYMFVLLLVASLLLLFFDWFNS